MSLLFGVVFRSACRCTHQRLALDALRFLRGADSDGWSDLVVHHHGEYLRGTMAPDEQFRDFANHVLFIGEHPFGNAPQEARRWYSRTVDALRRRDWPEAVWHAGVLSHYFSDPFMPLNTTCSEEQTQVHRAVEWCVHQSYGELQQILERDQDGYPQLEAPQTPDWLERMVWAGAELAHAHYQAVLDHFDLGRAVRNPLAGMDAQCRERLATCLGHAVVGFARVLERAIAEAEVEPPPVETTLQGFGIGVTRPLRWLGRQVTEASDRLAIEAVYDEVQRTGKALRNLTAEQREVRRLYAEEVLRVSLHQLDHQAAGMTGALHRHSADEPGYPNRLITAPPLCTPPRASSAWRDARRRVQDRNEPVRQMAAG